MSVQGPQDGPDPMVVFRAASVPRREAWRVRARPVRWWRWVARAAGVLAVWGGAALLLGTLAWWVDRDTSEEYRVLAARGVPADAVVTWIGDHNSVRYTFVLGTVRWQGGSFDDLDDQPVEKLSVGDRIRIRYDPQSPARSCACDDPSIRIHPFGPNLLLGVIAAPLLAGFLAAAAGPGPVRHWWMHAWGGWPTAVGARAVRWIAHGGATDDGSAGHEPPARGTLTVSPGRVTFSVDSTASRPGPAGTPGPWPGVVHTRAVLPLRHRSIQLRGNPLYGLDRDCVVELPWAWNVDDVAVLLASAGFEVVRMPRRWSRDRGYGDLPAEVEERLRTSRDLWA